MKKLIIFLLVTLTSCAGMQPIKNRKVIFSPGNDTFFAVHARAEGNMNVVDYNVRINLSNITFTANPKYHTSQHILFYRVCLANDMNKSGKWNMSKCSRIVNTNVTIKPGKTLSIPDQSLLIPNVAGLNKGWLVLLLARGDINDQVTDFIFTHSQKNIFKPGN